jgi:hypothetical protein
MAMGIIVTAFTLFGMLGLVIFNEALSDYPTQAQPRMLKPKPRARMAHNTADAARTRKKAA